MNRTASIAAALAVAVAASGCSSGGPSPAGEPANDPAAPQNLTESAPAAPASGRRWTLESNRAGLVLALAGPGNATLVRMSCPTGDRRLVVNVPAFRPIASEERLSFGSGGAAAALVADVRGDREHGGVSGDGETPDNLAALIGGPISVSYGAQSSGPHPAPPAPAARAFAQACAAPPPPEVPPPPVAGSEPPAAGACRTQDGRTIPPNMLRAIGTEPFWGARIEGRCIVYSHPDDQAGTRVWTRFEGSRDAGTWTGFYGGARFVLRTRPQAGCSDGMSDRRYPLAVSLLVSGEERSGCAERL